MRRWIFRTRRTDDRGVTVVAAAIFLPLLMASGAFVVDLGMHRVARVDLQALVDLVALDLSRELGGRTAAELRPVLADLAAESLARNPDVVGVVDPDLVIDLGDVSVAGTFVAIVDGTPTAVRVTGKSEVGYAFAGITGVHSGTATRRAVANSVQSACYSVGSYAASVNTSSSVLLDPLIDKLAEQTGGFSNGYGVGQAIGYQGLASASVKLGDVAAALSIGSVTELATAQVDLKRYYGAIKTAIGPGNAVAFAMLGAMATSANASRSVNLASILSVDSGSGALADLRANVLDLVLGSLYAINGTNGVDLYLSSGLTRLSYLGVKVKAIQGPHLYCGSPGSSFTTGTAAQTEQFNVTGQGNLSPFTVSTTLAPIPGLTLVAAQLSAPMWSSMPFSLSVAATLSSLEAVRCGATPGVDLEISNHLANLTLTNIQFSEASFSTKIRLLGVDVTVNIVVGNANASTIAVGLGSTATVPFVIDVPPKAYETPYPTQAGGVTAVATLNAGTSVRISPAVSLPLLGLYAGADVGILVSAADRLKIAQAVVDRVVQASFDATNPDSLTNKVFAPLLSLAGLKLAGADVILHGQPPMDCGIPALRG